MPDQQLTPIPLHRVATAMPFIQYLHQTGVRVERALKRSSLPVVAMDDPDCFIPSSTYRDFIANVAEREGIRELGFMVGLQSGADAADPGMARRLAKLASLHQALEQFCQFATTEISQVALWLEPADNNTHRLHYQTSFGIEHPAYIHFQWYGLMATLAAIQLFTGRRWQPRTIGLGTMKKPGITIRKHFPLTNFITRQAHCFISTSNHLLGKTPQVNEDLLQSSPRYARIKLPRDFIGTLKLALRSYLRDGTPSLELAAEIAELSPRTLQRRLAGEGLSYRGLLDAVRYETAIDLMQDTNNTVTDIASLLGYTEPSHFSRAFRRLAGVSPREHMQKIQE
jgi:AraC-like DNA-binding protein